jgi:hypothetical protein
MSHAQLCAKAPIRKRCGLNARRIATFGALRLHQSELDQGQLLSDVMVIANEVDEQLMTALLELAAKPTEAVA